MTKARLTLVTPSIVNRTVTPQRRPNVDLRTREHLTEAEVERLMDAARKNRWGHRDAAMVLVAYRHGFRPAELVDLRWEQIEFASAALHVRRVKRGTPSTHPILGDELRALPPPSTRAGAKIALRVHLRTRNAVHHCWLRPHG
jgi:type 1 fimbriae regulatory protein FimB/type 1 fimbriae regulatory protein FimE